MNDEDIARIATRLSQSLATKEDIKKLEEKIVRGVERLEEKIDTVLKFAESVDETVTDHEKRIQSIESIPVIAHEIRKKQ